MIQTLCDIGESYKIPREYDGAVYALHPDCICGKVGNEFTTTTNSLTATIQSGQAILCGNFFHISGTETISLTPNVSAFICLSIDTTRPNGSRGYISFKLESDIKKENINGSGTLRDFPIYKLTTNSNSVTAISDVRTIVDSGNQIFGGMTFQRKTEAEWATIEQSGNYPPAGTITVVRES